MFDRRKYNFSEVCVSSDLDSFRGSFGSESANRGSREIIRKIYPLCLSFPAHRPIYCSCQTPKRSLYRELLESTVSAFTLRAYFVLKHAYVYSHTRFFKTLESRSKKPADDIAIRHRNRFSSNPFSKHVKQRQISF